MKRIFVDLIVILSVLFVSIMIIGCQEQPESASITESSTPMPTPNYTNHTLVYANPENGFSLEYPETGITKKI